MTRPLNCYIYFIILTRSSVKCKKGFEGVGDGLHGGVRGGSEPSLHSVQGGHGNIVVGLVEMGEEEQIKEL